MPNLEDYLATYTAMHLEDAEKGKYSGDLVIPDSYKNGTADQKAKWKVVERGQTVFAENCAFCHSSKLPQSGDDLAALQTLRAYYISGNGQEDDATKKARETVKAYYRALVAKDDFLTENALTDDVRYPVSELKISAARALATNATSGHIWDQFSSPEYKALPAARPLTLYNPVTGKNDRVWQPPAGGRGYYRTTSLVGIWATAPFLHNNSVGTFNGSPQVIARVGAFNDGIHKLLWPNERDGVKTIKRVSTRTYLNIRLSVLEGVTREKLLAFQPKLPALLKDVKLPELFQLVPLDDLKDIPGINELDRLSLKIAIPAGTPINLLANINLSDKDKRLAAVLHFVKYAFQTDLAAAAHKLPIGGDELAKIPEQLAKDAMDELLKISEYPDLVEDHGHEYGADLGDDDKKALIEYLKKL
jgi:mono/diheme cytochrome c family protein